MMTITCPPFVHKSTQNQGIVIIIIYAFLNCKCKGREKGTFSILTFYILAIV